MCPCYGRWIFFLLFGFLTGSHSTGLKCDDQIYSCRLIGGCAGVPDLPPYKSLIMMRRYAGKMMRITWRASGKDEVGYVRMYHRQAMCERVIPKVKNRGRQC
ncbi:hypothetical protein DM02DRAFT_96263 [Periconia macrospinosa]|uniref:Uncharacterized protein n=1 Tax=Periconia macrospinosa TaxID=97972 RepID=A0A2V1DIE9_9PLEO|nr:hypothetical protein DM02DRAFT_96263 [Periconia macrospinosa]